MTNRIEAKLDFMKSSDDSGQELSELEKQLAAESFIGLCEDILSANMANARASLDHPSIPKATTVDSRLDADDGSYLFIGIVRSESAEETAIAPYAVWLKEHGPNPRQLRSHRYELSQNHTEVTRHDSGAIDELPAELIPPAFGDTNEAALARTALQLDFVREAIKKDKQEKAAGINTQAVGADEVDQLRLILESAIAIRVY